MGGEEGVIVGKGVGCHRETQQHVYRGRGYYVLCGVGSRIWWGLGVAVKFRVVLGKTWVNPE